MEFVDWGSDNCGGCSSHALVCGAQVAAAAGVALLVSLVGVKL